MITKNTQNTLYSLEAIAGEKLTLGSLLQSIRLGEELSQVDFSKMLGVSRQVICDIEHGRRSISPKKAAEYADLLGYSKKQFIRLALQDLLDREHLDFVVEVESAA